MDTSVLQQPLIAESLEFLYESVEEDINGDYDKFLDIVQGLCDTGYLELLQCNDDMFVYKAKTGIKWSDIVVLSDHIKKKILLQLIQNPKCFFVLFNTQRGKLRIIGQEIASWIALAHQRVVSYLVVSNDNLTFISFGEYCTLYKSLNASNSLIQSFSKCSFTYRFNWFLIDSESSLSQAGIFLTNCFSLSSK
jgi:hypothetical protein